MRLFDCTVPFGCLALSAGHMNVEVTELKRIYGELLHLKDFLGSYSRIPSMLAIQDSVKLRKAAALYLQNRTS